MEAYQTEQLKILIESLILIVRYKLRFKLMKQRFWEKIREFKSRNLKSSELHEIYQSLSEFQQSIDEVSAYQEQFYNLINMLDGYRYYYSVQSNNAYLLEKILNAMIAALFFNEAHVAAYKSLVLEERAIPLYLQELLQGELFAIYEQYYKKQHSILGRRIERLKISDIELVAKQGMINGKLFELLGEKGLITHGLTYIQKELQAILNKNHFVGFLTKEHLDGYLDKIQLLISHYHPPSFLSPPIPPMQPAEETLVQNARYLLENITYACGVTSEDQARYPEHQNLIKACFWVDEMFKGIKGELESDYLI
jgi:hypothetical protein